MSGREELPDDEVDLTLDEMLDLVTPENQHGSLWEVSADSELCALLDAPGESSGADERAMDTRGRIESIDGDLVIRIPPTVAAFLGYEDGREVQIRIEESRLVIKTTIQQRYTLEDLLSRSTAENRHPEVDWGPPVGNEF